MTSVTPDLVLIFGFAVYSLNAKEYILRSVGNVLNGYFLGITRRSSVFSKEYPNNYITGLSKAIV